MTFLRTAFFTALSTCLLFSCEEDEKGPKYEFEDQLLQGMIDGVAYTYGEGSVDFYTEGKMSFDLYSDMETTSVCDMFGFGDYVVAFFSMNAEEGLTELKFSLDGSGSQTVTLFNPENTLNSIVTEGAIEITSITTTSVTGKMDIKMDKENYLNGNFTALVCE